MTETQKLSIEEVRALVVERQRYDDWLGALESRRAETPVRVYERVQADYAGRRKDVALRLRSHLGALSGMAAELDARLSAIEGTIGTLEDERAEAMLRTAVGEFDGTRWEEVRQQVEAKIAELGDQRSTLVADSGEVRALLDSARAAHEEVASEPAEVAVALASATASATASESQSEHVHARPERLPEPAADPVIDTGNSAVGHSVSADLLGDEGFVEAMPSESALRVSQPTTDELADLDNALAMFSGDAPNSSFVQSLPTPRSLNGVDVFDDAELGDLRMDPPGRSAAVATPPAAPAVDRPDGAAFASPGDAPTGNDGFDDLAFLRSVVEPGSGTGANRAATTGDQAKTLRCTECGTMNLPTEWYCERCGGELAAF